MSWNLLAAMMVVKTFLVIMEAMPPTMLGPSIGCKSAPKTSAEQVPGAQTMVDLLVHWEIPPKKWPSHNEVTKPDQTWNFQMIQYVSTLQDSALQLVLTNLSENSSKKIVLVARS